MYPTRVARFGVAITPSGTMRLKAKEYSKDLLPVEEGCLCSTCGHYSRAFLHTAFKDNNALAAQLLTIHNIAHMMTLMRTMRLVRFIESLSCAMIIIAYCYNADIIYYSYHTNRNTDSNSSNYNSDMNHYNGTNLDFYDNNAYNTHRQVTYSIK